MSNGWRWTSCVYGMKRMRLIEYLSVALIYALESSAPNWMCAEDAAMTTSGRNSQFIIAEIAQIGWGGACVCVLIIHECSLGIVWKNGESFRYFARGYLFAFAAHEFNKTKSIIMKSSGKYWMSGRVAVDGVKRKWHHMMSILDAAV